VSPPVLPAKGNITGNTASGSTNAIIENPDPVSMEGKNVKIDTGLMDDHAAIAYADAGGHADDSISLRHDDETRS
jgi:hypothetical protein